LRNCCGFDAKKTMEEMCSGSEAGSYLRLIDFVYHSTLGLRVIKKKAMEVREGFHPVKPRGEG